MSNQLAFQDAMSIAVKKVKGTVMQLNVDKPFITRVGSDPNGIRYIQNDVCFDNAQKPLGKMVKGKFIALKDTLPTQAELDAQKAAEEAAAAELAEAQRLLDEAAALAEADRLAAEEAARLAAENGSEGDGAGNLNSNNTGAGTGDPDSTGGTTGNGGDDDEDDGLDEMDLDALKAFAKSIDITFAPNIGEDTLRAKIRENAK